MKRNNKCNAIKWKEMNGSGNRIGTHLHMVGAIKGPQELFTAVWNGCRNTPLNSSESLTQVISNIQIFKTGRGKFEFISLFLPLLTAYHWAHFLFLFFFISIHLHLLVIRNLTKFPSDCIFKIEIQFNSIFFFRFVEISIFF